jgi:predicted lipid-binding transport protein (Tim44 family)
LIVQVLELLIFAALAAVVLYQLYAVLGRRVGRQPEDQPELPSRPVAPGLTASRPPVDEVALSGLAAIKARDPAFDIEHFLQGARGAYETIVRAFTSGDRVALNTLVSPEVMKGFEAAIDEREAAGRTETVEFLQPVRADVEESKVENDAARIKVRFLGEFRSRTKGPEGEGVDDRRTAENWTFQRPLSSRDPNWTLVRVEAAEA